MSNLGAPLYELTRSPASERVMRLAIESNVFLAHFEHRVELPLPPHWLPIDRPDLAAAPGWQGGTLPESKYHSFRHERRIGSFHPGHRTKWTGHELCHSVIGFAWRPNASRLFDALAARLAEALPVALWYFFDEDGLRRCRDHAGGGPLFDGFCARCEAAHAKGSDPDHHEQRWARDGLQFLDRELEAIDRSLAEGRVIPSRYATLDLGSDGLAYAAAHGRRLNAPTFARYIETFFPAGTGWHASLTDLADRVREVAADLVGRGTAAPLTGDRDRWITQDVAWRLFQVREETGGEAGDVLDHIIDGLANAPTEHGVGNAIDAYKALEDDFELPAPEDVFAVGYPLPRGYGRSASQVEAGVRAGLPATAVFLEEDVSELVSMFLVTDDPVREPLGTRFARFLEEANPKAAALARYESALAHAPAPDLEAITLAEDVGTEALTLSDSARVIRADWNVAEYAAAIDEGREPQIDDEPASVLIVRAANGDVLVSPLTEEEADLLGALPGDIPHTSHVQEWIALGALRSAPTVDTFTATRGPPPLGRRSE